MVKWYNNCPAASPTAVRIPSRRSPTRAYRPIVSFLPDCGSNPSKHKLLTPSPPTPKMRFPVSGDRGLKIKKIHWGIILSGKIMIYKGVRHPISCLGVCYANDPPKMGVYSVRACACLTTSLRGDSIAFGKAPRREMRDLGPNQITVAAMGQPRFAHMQTSENSAFGGSISTARRT